MLHDPLARHLETSQPLRQSWNRYVIPLSSLSTSLVHVNRDENTNSAFEDPEIYPNIFSCLSCLARDENLP